MRKEEEEVKEGEGVRKGRKGNVRKEKASRRWNRDERRRKGREKRGAES